MNILNRLSFRKDPLKQQEDKFREIDSLYTNDAEMQDYSKATWLVSRANDYGKKSKIDLAIVDYVEAIKIKHDHLPAYLGLSVALNIKDDESRAQQIIESMPPTMRLHGKIIAKKDDFLQHD